MAKAKYEFSEELKDMAEELIEKVPEFRNIKVLAPKIAYMVSDQKKTSKGMTVHGDCEKVKPKMKRIMPYDYIITFYTNNIKHMTSDQLRILMMHELYHIDCGEDDEGNLSCNIRPHDIQDFRFVTDKYGLDWAR